MTYGAKKVELGDFNVVTGAMENMVEVPVYKDSFNLTEAEPTVNEHFQQGKSAPRLRRITPQSIQIAFNIMETDPDTLLDLLGGTVVNTPGPPAYDTWNAPDLREEQIKALQITTEDDSVIKVPRFQMYARPDVKATDADVNLVMITGSPTETGVAGVKAWRWDEPGV